MKTPKTLQDAIKFYSDQDRCIDLLANRRWPNGVECPTCGSKEVHFIPTRRLWECKNKHARKQFSVKVGTLFEDSAIGLDKWLTAMWMIANCKNGVSSYEIARAIGVTQKSAWFMLHRLRAAVARQKFGNMTKLGGPNSEVEVDEAWVGGKVANMHKERRARYQTADTKWGKVIVMGMLDRSTRQIRTEIIPNVDRGTLQSQVLNNIKYGTKVYTDQAPAYSVLAKHYIHDFVNHAVEYVNGQVHTNSLENFWSLFKRNLRGTYVSVEPFHMFRYLDEQMFRFNNRGTKQQKVSDFDRFSMFASQIFNKRLTYAEVTGKNEEAPF